MAAINTTDVSAVLNDYVGSILFDPNAAGEGSLFFPGGPLSSYIQWEYPDNDVSAQFAYWDDLGVIKLDDGVEIGAVSNPSLNNTQVVSYEFATNPVTISIRALEAMGSGSFEAKMQSYAVNMTNRLRRYVDEAILATASSLTAGRAAADTALTVAQTITAITTLQKLDVQAPYVGVLAPAQAEDIFVDTTNAVAAMNVRGTDTMQSGIIGNLYGVNFYTSNSVKTASSIAYAPIIGKNAIGAIMRRQPRIVVATDDYNRIMKFSAIMDFGVGVIDATGGVYIGSSDD